MIAIDKDVRDALSRINRKSGSLLKLLAQFERLCAHPVENAHALDQVLSQIATQSGDMDCTDMDARLASWIQSSTSELASLKETFKHDFAHALQGLLESKGLELGGRYPDLKVKYYTIHLDFAKGVTSLAFGHEQIKQRIPLSPQDVARALEEAEGSLSHAFDGQMFIEKLFEAYQRVCRIRELPCGEKVPILEVLQQFVFLRQSSRFVADPCKEHFHGYSRAQFGFDLYRLRLSGVRTADGRTVGLLTATFDATRQREHFIWVPDNERGEGTTYALICFRRLEDALP